MLQQTASWIKPFLREKRERSYLLLWLFLFRVIYVVCSTLCVRLSRFFLENSKQVQVCRIDAVNVIINIFMEKGRECKQKWSTKLKQWNETKHGNFEHFFSLSRLLRSKQFDGIFGHGCIACVRVHLFRFSFLLFHFVFISFLFCCLFFVMCRWFSPNLCAA